MNKDEEGRVAAKAVQGPELARRRWQTEAALQDRDAAESDGQSAGRAERADRAHAERYLPAPNRALTYSRVIRAMFEIGISFGQTASHSPSFEQLPNPSASAWSIIATTRV